MPNFITPEGLTVSVPEEAVAVALANGYKPESVDAGLQRASTEGELRDYQGAADTARAFIGSAISGATLGLSDVVLADRDDMLAREAHPTASTVGNIAGAVVPSLAAPGAGPLSSLSKLTPAGKLSSVASKIVASGAEKGVVKRVGTAIAGGALEGGVQNAGMYISDVALKDKPLSAEAFVGALGQGAMFGGAIGGGLALSEKALVRAKSLFPKQEVTQATAHDASIVARREWAASLADQRDMSRIAKDKKAAARAAKAEYDAAFKAEQDRIKLLHQEEKRAAKLAETTAKKEAVALDKAKKGKNLKVTVPGDQEAIDALNAEAAAARQQSEAYVAEQRALREAEKAAKPLKGTAATRRMFKAMGGDIDEARASYAAEAAAFDAPAAAPATAPVAAAADEMTDLERQLAGTKARLDAGESLADIGLEDKLDDALAKSDPQMAKIVNAERDVRMARADIDAWIEKHRNPNRSYVDSDGSGRGGISPRKMDRIETPIEESAEASAARLDDLKGRTFGAESLGKQIASGKMPSRYGSLSEDDLVEMVRLDAADRARAGVDRVDDIEDALAKALDAKPAGGAAIDDDIATAINLIGKHEEASAKLAQALGPDAPPAALRRAEEYFAAVDDQSRKLTEQTANLTESLDAAVTNPVDPLEQLRLKAESMKVDADAAQSNLSAAMSRHQDNVAKTKVAEAEVRAEGRKAGVSKALDVASAVEVLSMFGAPGLPNVDAIPVIGPVLGLWLKARAIGMVWRRFGAKVPASAESKVAQKGAAVRQRVASALDRAFGIGAKGVERAARPARSVSGILAHSLFALDEPKRTRSEPAPQRQEVYRLYDQRMNELAQAQRAGAVKSAVRQRIQVADPDLEAAIIDATQRKLDFLNRVAPRPPGPTSLMPSPLPWHPSKAELDKFARYVEAADDPAGVMERLADHGEVTTEGAQVLREVYPALYAEAQQMLLSRASELQTKLPYARQVSLSLLFGVPVNPTMAPEYIDFLKRGATGAPAPTAMPAQGAPGPMPTTAGPVDLGTRTMTSLDRRAGV